MGALPVEGNPRFAGKSAIRGLMCWPRGAWGVDSALGGETRQDQGSGTHLRSANLPARFAREAARALRLGM